WPRSPTASSKSAAPSSASAWRTTGASDSSSAAGPRRHAARPQVAELQRAVASEEVDRNLRVRQPQRAAELPADYQCRGASADDEAERRRPVRRARRQREIVDDVTAGNGARPVPCQVEVLRSTSHIDETEAQLGRRARVGD